MNFHDRVEAVRKAKALTVAEVLDFIGVSPAMLSMIKAGSRNPSLKTVRRLMEAERACGIVPPEDFALPKEKLEKLEYEIPGDPAILREGSRKVRENVDLIKAIRLAVGIETRETLREEMKEIRKEILAEIAVLLGTRKKKENGK